MIAEQKRLRVGIIGAGRIGSMLCRAIARGAPTVSVTLASRDRSRCEALQRDICDLTIAEPGSLVTHVDVLMLAVPAEAYVELLRSLAPTLAPGCIVISLTNGVTLDELGAEVANPIVEIVPTMAHLVGRGVALVVAGPRATDEHVALTSEFLSAFSRPITIDDGHARAATNVAGSFLALAAAFTDTFVRANASRAPTLDQSELEAMAAEALGAVSDLVAAGHNLRDIVAATATPGGPTEGALAVLAKWADKAAVEMVEATFRNQASQRRAAGQGCRTEGEPRRN